MVRYSSLDYKTYKPVALIISVSVIRGLKNKDELAVILGHEIEHIKQKLDHDAWLNNKRYYTLAQSQADLAGYHYAEKAGYNALGGAQVFYRLLSTYKDKTSQFRIDKLQELNVL